MLGVAQLSAAGRRFLLLRQPESLRTFCGHGLESFGQLMDRGLGAGRQFRDMQASMAAALCSQGWFVHDGLLGTETCLRIRAEAARLHASGQFAQSYSEVVETGEKIWRQGVHAMELGPETWKMAPTLVVYLAELMRELPPVLNETFRDLRVSDSLFGHKLAVSVGAGSHYPKHLDNVSGAPSDTRKLTAIYYMNPGWDSRNGGAIRLYSRLEEPSYVDVEPTGDRLLLFWSDLLVHEVLPSWSSDRSSHRYTFTVWLTSENHGRIVDWRDPQFRLRLAHFPSRS